MVVLPAISLGAGKVKKKVRPFFLMAEPPSRLSGKLAATEHANPNRRHGPPFLTEG